MGVTYFLSLRSPNTNNTNNAYYLNTNGNVNNNNCTNTNGARPALMVRSDRVSPKLKAVPSITSKEVIPSLGASKANTLRRCPAPILNGWQAAGPVGTAPERRIRSGRLAATRQEAVHEQITQGLEFC